MKLFIRYKGIELACFAGQLYPPLGTKTPEAISPKELTRYNFSPISKTFSIQFCLIIHKMLLNTIQFK